MPVPGRALLALGTYLAEARPELEKQPAPALFLSRYGRRMDVQSVNLARALRTRALARRPRDTARCCATPARRTSSGAAPTCATSSGSSATSTS